MTQRLHEDFAANQVTVGTSATLIQASQFGVDEVTIQQLGTTPVYIGKAGVTTSSGFPLPGVVGAALTLPVTEAIYGIVSSGTQAVAVLVTF